MIMRLRGEEDFLASLKAEEEWLDTKAQHYLKELEYKRGLICEAEMRVESMKKERGK